MEPDLAETGEARVSAERRRELGGRGGGREEVDGAGYSRVEEPETVGGRGGDAVGAKAARDIRSVALVGENIRSSGAFLFVRFLFGGRRFGVLAGEWGLPVQASRIVPALVGSEVGGRFKLLLVHVGPDR